MCRTSLPTCDDVLPMSRLSVQEVGIVEAMRHKWIESEKAGHDLGEIAIRCWVHEHWHGFLRAKWLEHLEGKTFYGRRQFAHRPTVYSLIPSARGCILPRTQTGGHSRLRGA